MPFLKARINYLTFAFLMGSLGTLSAQGHPPRQYQIKAVFLYNFTKFVDWSVPAFPDENAPLVIGILGEDPFGSYLDEVIAGEKLKDHPLLIQRYNSTEEIRDCHILFINLPDQNKTAEIIESIKGRSILTVSDAPDFLELGGMVRFVTIDKKIRLQINPEASEASAIKISSKLLRLADIFIPEK